MDGSNTIAYLGIPVVLGTASSVTMPVKYLTTLMIVLAPVEDATKGPVSSSILNIALEPGVKMCTMRFTKIVYAGFE